MVLENGHGRRVVEALMEDNYPEGELKLSVVIPMNV